MTTATLEMEYKPKKVTMTKLEFTEHDVRKCIIEGLVLPQNWKRLDAKAICPHPADYSAPVQYYRVNVYSIVDNPELVTRVWRMDATFFVKVKINEEGKLELSDETIREENNTFFS